MPQSGVAVKALDHFRPMVNFRKCQPQVIRCHVVPPHGNQARGFSALSHRVRRWHTRCSLGLARAVIRSAHRERAHLLWERTHDEAQRARRHRRLCPVGGRRSQRPVLCEGSRGAPRARGRGQDARRPDGVATGPLHGRARGIPRSRPARGRARSALQPRQLCRLPFPAGHRRDEPRRESTSRGRHRLRRSQRRAVVHHPRRAGAGGAIQAQAQRHPRWWRPRTVRRQRTERRDGRRQWLPHLAGRLRGPARGR